MDFVCLCIAVYFSLACFGSWYARQRLTPLNLVCVLQWCPVLPHLAEMEYLLLQTSDDDSETGASSNRRVTFYA